MASTSSRGQPNSKPKHIGKMPSNKALNANELLNFSLPPRQTRPTSAIPKRSKQTGNVHGVWNKERFVNAQYRFVMNPNGDYTVHFADPDIFFQWNDILQIIVPRISPLACVAGDSAFSDVEGLTTCPICLSPPTAARMTKCGHVFCYPCILHYLSTSENKWARCPICFDSVHERQLKSVKWYDDISAGVPIGPEISFLESGAATGRSQRKDVQLRMRLIQRPQITTLALPRSQIWPSELLPLHQAPFHFLPDVFCFSKFMLATPEYLIADLTKELEELAAERRIISGMEDALSLYFINGADEKVRHQIEEATALETPLLMERIAKSRRDQKEIQDKAAAADRRRVALEQADSTAMAPNAPTEFLASRAGHSYSDTPTPSSSREPHQNRSNQRRNINPPPPSTSTYYYYQAASGLPIYLHPLEIKILFSHFKGYSSFPDEITVKVAAWSEGTVDDNFRKRCKYLGHLPEGVDVMFIEADLEGVVGKEGLKNFEAGLRARSTRRKDKVKKDDNAKAKAEGREREKEMESLTRFLPSSRPLSSSPNDFVPLESARRDSNSESETRSNTSTSPPIASGAWGNRSFASALHSSAQRNANPQAARRQEVAEEDWDPDAMWHELEARTVAGDGGGKKNKRGSRMVVLGGGGAGARRR